MENTEILSISKILSENIKETSFKSGTRCCLLDVMEDLILVWSNKNGCLFAQTLQDTGKPQCKVQTLSLSRSPVWDVERIVVNRRGSGVLLIGERGIAVLELPKRWGTPPLFHGGDDSITCRVEYIGERFFSCNPKINIISGAWHPGSFDCSHITVLSSDNYLRIYNLASREMCEQAFPVGISSHPTSCHSGTSKFGGGSMLGETAVAFDFGPAVETETQSIDHNDNGISNVIDDCMEERRRHLEMRWPMFILYGNGDVYYTITSLGRARIQRKIYGPLSMTPKCTDNYGVDYCSLLVLQCSPPVLVLGNSSGMLHHCIVVESESENESETQQQQQLELSFSDLMSTSVTKPMPSTGVSLHVYESVQLQLSVCPVDSAPYTCPLMLHMDPTTPARYWVSHDTGVHAVSVPVIDQLSNFSQLPEGSDYDFSDCECIAQHLLCTRQLSSQPILPVVGLGTFPSPKCQPRVMVLLASMAIKTLNINTAPSIPPYSSITPAPSASPLRKVHTESFESHIRNTLCRSQCQPLMTSCGSEGDVGVQEYLSSLVRTTETLRKQYLQPQQAAREVIQRRTSMLLEQRSRLECDIELLVTERKQLTNGAHDLAEKYEEANYKHIQLQARLERVMSQIIRGVPLLSSAERTMLKELETMKDNAPELKNQLAQVKSKLKWQLTQMEKNSINESLKSKQSTAISDSYLKNVKKSLTKEIDDTSVLVQKVNQMKKDLCL